MKTLMLTVVGSIIALPLSAADLRLVRGTDASWNTDSNNQVWVDESGNATGYKNGDNVLVSSEYFTGGTLYMNELLAPSNVVFDIDRNLELRINSKQTRGLGPDTRSFTKRGKGTLTLLSATASETGELSHGNSMTCGVEIVEGEIACNQANHHNFLGPRTVPFWVYVRDGASLTFLQRNQTGTFSSPECGIKIQLDAGGTLNNNTNSTSAGSSCLSVNTLKFNGGDYRTSSKGYFRDNARLGGDCTLKIFNTLQFSGQTPHAFGFTYSGCKSYTSSDTFNGYKVSLNSYAPVELRVDDITGDGNVDAYVNMSMFTWGTNAVGVYRCDLVKTGSGTLRFPSTSTTKTFLGDFTIREGTVEFTQQGFFPSDGTEEQTLSVMTNATLSMTCRNAIDGTLANTNPQVDIVVDHGTFRFVPTTNMQGTLRARDWTFDDATLDIHNPGMAIAGVLYFRRKAAFRGTHQLEMLPDETIDTANQAVCVHIDDEGVRTVIDVDEMTGDGRADVIMGYPVWNGSKSGADASQVLTGSGFVKTGVGTFSVASLANKVSGVVTVSNGTMRVDGSLVTPSSVEVAAGAYLGGTGTVANVALEAGAGFAAPAGQETPLTVQGDLALPATGVIDIANLDGVAEKDMPAAVLVGSTGSISGAENLGNWTVRVDGVRSRKWKLSLSGGVLRASYSNGMCVVVR